MFRDGNIDSISVRLCSTGDGLVTAASQKPASRQRQTGKQRAVRSDNRDVDGEMVPAELNHPGRSCRRSPEERNVVLVESEASAAAASSSPVGSRSLTATGPPASGILQDLIAVHDVGDLVVTLAAQGCGNQRERRLALLRRQVAEAQAIPLKSSSGKVGPAGCC